MNNKSDRPNWTPNPERPKAITVATPKQGLEATEESLDWLKSKIRERLDQYFRKIKQGVLEDQIVEVADDIFFAQKEAFGRSRIQESRAAIDALDILTRKLGLSKRCRRILCEIRRGLNEL